MAELSPPRQALFGLPEGTVALTYPMPLSAESLSELREFLAIVLRQLERRIPPQNPGDAAPHQEG